MDLDKIRAGLTDFLEAKNLKLFEMNYRKSDSTLEVLLDEKLDIDEIEKVSGEISAFMDGYEDEFPDNYFLDVGNIGAERPIRNEEEIMGAIGQYIYVKTKEEEVYGTLKSYTDGILNLEVQDKTRLKNKSVDYKKTKKVRYAVKF